MVPRFPLGGREAVAPEWSKGIGVDVDGGVERELVE